MFANTATRWIVGTLLLIAALGVLRHKPWRLWGQGTRATARAELQVGFLPVT